MNGNSRGDKERFTETNTGQMGFRWGAGLGELLCQLNDWRNEKAFKIIK